MTDWPEGCRIVFSLPNPTTNKLIIEDVLSARAFKLVEGELRLYSDAGVLVGLVNFASVLLIVPLKTVGPSNAHN